MPRMLRPYHRMINRLIILGTLCTPLTAESKSASPKHAEQGKPRLLFLRSTDIAPSGGSLGEAEDRTIDTYRQRGVEVLVRDPEQFNAWLKEKGKELEDARRSLQMVAFTRSLGVNAAGGLAVTEVDDSLAESYGLAPGRYVHSWGFSLAGCTYNDVIDVHRNITGLTLPLHLAGAGTDPWSVPRFVDADRHPPPLSPSQQAIADRLLGRSLPELATHDIEGLAFSLRGLRGKVVVLDLWATWCHGCVEEMPVQQMIWQEYRERDFALVTVSADEDERVWSRFLRRNPLGGTHVRAPDWIADLAIESFPTILILDREGVVKSFARGNALAPAVARLRESNRIGVQP